MPNWKKVVVSGSAANLHSLNVSTDVAASNISSSGNIFGNLSENSSTSFKTVVVDPSTGQFYRTGSYGGGGGAGGSTFPFIGDAEITGSISISGSGGLKVKGPIEVSMTASSGVIPLSIKTISDLSSDVLIQIRDDGGSYDLMTFDSEGRFNMRGTSTDAEGAGFYSSQGGVVHDHVRMGFVSGKAHLSISANAGDKFKVLTNADNRSPMVGLSGRGTLALGTDVSAATLPNEARTNTMFIKTGTAPSTAEADNIQFFAQDVNSVAGTASPTFLTEDGTTIQLGVTSSLSYVSASAFKGDGSQLTNLPSSDPFPFAGDGIISGSLLISSSNVGGVSTSSLTLQGSGSTIFDIQGSQGQLFSVTDDLIHDVFNVSDISGDTLLKVSGSGLVEIPVGNLSGSATSTASFGHYIGDGANLTGLISSSYAVTASHALNVTTPTLQEVTTAGNTTNQGLIVTGSTTFKPISSGDGGAIELTNIGYSGLDNPIMTFKDGQGNSNVVIGHRANDGQIQIYDQPDSLRTVLSANFSAFNPGSTTGNGTYFGLTSSMAPTSTNGRAYIKMYEANYSGAPAYNFQLNNRNYAAGSGTIGLYGIMSTTSTAAPAIQITSINSDKVVNFGGPSFIHSSGKQNNYLKYGLQIGGGFTGTNANMPLTDGSLIMSGSGGLFSIKSVSSEAEIKTNNGATTLTLGTTSSFTAVSASSYISASKFIGDGSGLTNLPAASAGSTAGRVVFTTTNGELTSETGFTYDATTDRLTVPNLTTTTFTASFITSSTIETSGSNIFGDEAGVDIQTLIGTTKMTGSAEVTGSVSILGDTQITGSLKILPATNINAPVKIYGAGASTVVGFGDNSTRFTFGSSGTATMVGFKMYSGILAGSLDGGSQVINKLDRLELGGYGFGGTSVIGMVSPSGTVTVPGNGFAMYPNDANGAGTVSPHFKTEDGSILTLATTSSLKRVTADSSKISGSGGLTVESSGSTVFEVIGSEGTLLSVDDDLDGTIFTANDKTGLPVLQASASGEVYIGKNPQSLYTTAVISSTTADVTQSLYGLDTSSYGGAFFDYIAHSGSNARGGTVSSVWTPGGSVVFSETTTTHIGDTSNLNLVVHFSQSQAQLACYADTSQYNIKVITRAI